MTDRQSRFSDVHNSNQPPAPLIHGVGVRPPDGSIAPPPHREHPPYYPPHHGNAPPPPGYHHGAYPAQPGMPHGAHPGSNHPPGMHHRPGYPPPAPPPPDGSMPPHSFGGSNRPPYPPPQQHPPPPPPQQYGQAPQPHPMGYGGAPAPMQPPYPPPQHPGFHQPYSHHHPPPPAPAPHQQHYPPPPGPPHPPAPHNFGRHAQPPPPRQHQPPQQHQHHQKNDQHAAEAENIKSLISRLGGGQYYAHYESLKTEVHKQLVMPFMPQPISLPFADTVISAQIHQQHKGTAESREFSLLWVRIQKKLSYAFDQYRKRIAYEFEYPSLDNIQNQRKQERIDYLKQCEKEDKEKCRRLRIAAYRRTKFQELEAARLEAIAAAAANPSDEATPPPPPPEPIKMQDIPIQTYMLPENYEPSPDEMKLREKERDEQEKQARDAALASQTTYLSPLEKIHAKYDAMEQKVREEAREKLKTQIGEYHLTDIVTDLPPDFNPSAPLYALVRLGQRFPVVKLLAKYLENLGSKATATINLRFAEQDTTLIHRACWNGDTDVVTLLVKYGAITNCTNIYGEHPAQVITIGHLHKRFDQRTAKQLTQLINENLYRGTDVVIDNVHDETILIGKPPKWVKKIQRTEFSYIVQTLHASKLKEQLEAKKKAIRTTIKTTPRISPVQKQELYKPVKALEAQITTVLDSASALIQDQKYVHLTGIPFEYPLQHVKQWFTACGVIKSIYAKKTSLYDIYQKRAEDHLIAKETSKQPSLHIQDDDDDKIAALNRPPIKTHSGSCIILFEKASSVAKALKYDHYPILGRVIRVTRLPLSKKDRSSLRQEIEAAKLQMPLKEYIQYLAEKKREQMEELKQMQGADALKELKLEEQTKNKEEKALELKRQKERQEFMLKLHQKKIQLFTRHKHHRAAERAARQEKSKLELFPLFGEDMQSGPLIHAVTPPPSDLPLIDQANHVLSALPNMTVLPIQNKSTSGEVLTNHVTTPAWYHNTDASTTSSQARLHIINIPYEVSCYQVLAFVFSKLYEALHPDSPLLSTIRTTSDMELLSAAPGYGTITARQAGDGDNATNEMDDDAFDQTMNDDQESISQHANTKSKDMNRSVQETEHVLISTLQMKFKEQYPYLYQQQQAYPHLQIIPLILRWTMPMRRLRIGNKVDQILSKHSRDRVHLHRGTMIIEFTDPLLVSLAILKCDGVNLLDFVAYQYTVWKGQIYDEEYARRQAAKALEQKNPPVSPTTPTETEGDGVGPAATESTADQQDAAPVDMVNDDNETEPPHSVLSPSDLVNPSDSTATETTAAMTTDGTDNDQNAAVATPAIAESDQTAMDSNEGQEKDSNDSDDSKSSTKPSGLIPVSIVLARQKAEEITTPFQRFYEQFDIPALFENNLNPIYRKQNVISRVVRRPTDKNISVSDYQQQEVATAISLINADMESDDKDDNDEQRGSTTSKNQGSSHDMSSDKDKTTFMRSKHSTFDSSYLNATKTVFLGKSTDVLLNQAALFNYQDDHETKTSGKNDDGNATTNDEDDGNAVPALFIESEFDILQKQAMSEAQRILEHSKKFTRSTPASQPSKKQRVDPTVKGGEDDDQAIVQLAKPEVDKSLEDGEVELDDDDILF